MESISSFKTILLIDDDVNIRLVIKKLLLEILIQPKVYTSGKGIDGLGLAYIVKPDIIILDTTLPKYSGREVIDFIITNKVFQNTKIIVLHEDNDVSQLNSLGYFILSKKDKDFPESLINIIKADRQFKEEGRSYKLSLSLGKKVIFFANSSDNNTRIIENNSDVSSRIKNIFGFIFNQILTSIYLTLFLILQGRKNEEETLIQDQEEFKVYRSRVYPTFILWGIIVVIVAAILIQILVLIGNRG